VRQIKLYRNLAMDCRRAREVRRHGDHHGGRPEVPCNSSASKSASTRLCALLRHWVYLTDFYSKKGIAASRQRAPPIAPDGRATVQQQLQSDASGTVRWIRADHRELAKFHLD
jgi:hypothetical protein